MVVLVLSQFCRQGCSSPCWSCSFLLYSAFVWLGLKTQVSDLRIVLLAHRVSGFEASNPLTCAIVFPKDRFLAHSPISHSWISPLGREDAVACLPPLDEKRSESPFPFICTFQTARYKSWFLSVLRSPLLSFPQVGALPKTPFDSRGPDPRGVRRGPLPGLHVLLLACSLPRVPPGFEEINVKFLPTKASTPALQCAHVFPTPFFYSSDAKGDSYAGSSPLF